MQSLNVKGCYLLNISLSLLFNDQNARSCDLAFIMRPYKWLFKTFKGNFLEIAVISRYKDEVTIEIITLPCTCIFFFKHYGAKQLATGSDAQLLLPLAPKGSLKLVKQIWLVHLNAIDEDGLSNFHQSLHTVFLYFVTHITQINTINW